ncbi:MAG: hypothetical protein HKN47_12210, partial [Pirellulaceae bacterium]|nr:hypothetical protein [Pirellulaceae bacterium]
GTSQQQDRDPIILEAAEGAEIRFAESLDMMSGGAPPIKRGRMMGLVEIRRESTDPDTKPLLIQTTNVGIDNRKLWTTEPIHMRLGDARMVGRDLTLHLSSSPGASSGGRGAAAVLDRMELIYLDELFIPLEKNALAKNQAKLAAESSPAAALAPASATPSSTYPAALSFKCDGRIEYDFTLDRLTLQDNVALTHQVPGVAADRFLCSVLDLEFNDLSNRDLQRERPLDWLDQIQATGSPVIVDLPSLDCRITAEQIMFDAVGGLLRASGRSGVHVRRGQIEAQLTQLAYQYNPLEPESIGTIDTLGAGTIDINDPELPVRQIKWLEQFKLQPLGVANVDQPLSDLSLRINGSIEARFADGGDFHADAIDGVLRQVTQPGVIPGEQPKQTLRPDRFQATGSVRIDNHAVAAETERLVLFFVDEPDPKPAVIGGDGVESQSSNSIRQWVAQPGATSAPVDPVARQRPVIRGDLITAKLRMNESGVSAKDLSVVGSVKLVHSLDAGGQTLPAELTGSELRLIDGGGKDVLHLGSRTGEPSQFKIGDGYFIGPLIRVWPNDNVVRIEGAGEFRMPTAVLPQSLSGGDTDRIRWTTAPHCKWAGEMVFDGKTATLSDGVDITAELEDRNQPWTLHMVGDRLEIVLLEDVKVGQVESIRSAAIQKITLLQSAKHPLLVQAERRAADGVLESRHVLQSPRLTLWPTGGGKLTGAGPGWYRSWMFADASGPLSKPDEQPKDTTEKSLIGMHLVYHQAIEGDLANQMLAFLRGVRVGVRPVEDWQTSFDAHQMDTISIGESTVDCDILQIAVAPGFRHDRNLPGLPTPWEMQARDGVVFRTRSENGLLQGTASRAVYSSSKDLFTIEGAPNRGAVIQQTQVNGQPGPKLTVREMTIRPRTLEIENMQLERLNLGTLPTPEKR